MIEILKKFLDEDEILKAEKLPEAAIKALQESLKILDPYSDVFPDDVLDAIKKLAGLVAESGDGKDYGYSYPGKKPDENYGVKKRSDLKWPSFFVDAADVTRGTLGIGKSYNPNPFGEENPDPEDDEEKTFQKGGETIPHKRPVSKRIEGQDDEDEPGGDYDGPRWPSLTGELE